MKKKSNQIEYIKPDLIDLNEIYGFSQTCTSGTTNFDDDDENDDCNKIVQVCNTGSSEPTNESPCVAGAGTVYDHDDEQYDDVVEEIDDEEDEGTDNSEETNN